MPLAILVPGGTGQLGSDIAELAAANGLDVRAPGSAELDVTDVGRVIREVRALAVAARAAGKNPVVLNAAAYTAVDDAESDEPRAFAVNADGPRVLAAACASQRIPLVHVSTDYVFSGDTDRAYRPDDPLGARSAYGRTKGAGEAAVLGSGASAWVVRTSWLYGATGKNFVKTMARFERERDVVSVVDDQRGCPTWTADLAAGLIELVRLIADGRGPAQQILHCTNAGDASWWEFARATFTELGADPARVRPCTTADFPRPAPRPAYSVLSNQSWFDAGLTPLRDWRAALAEFVSTFRADL